MHLVWPTVVGGDNPEARFLRVARDGQRFTARRSPDARQPEAVHPQIAVDPARRIFVAWDELAGGRQTAALREVRVDASGPIGLSTFGSIVTLSSAESGVYPVLAATGNRVLATWATGGDRSRIQVRAIAMP